MHEEEELKLIFQQIKNTDELLVFYDLVKELLEYTDKEKMIQSFVYLLSQNKQFVGVFQDSKPVGFVQYGFSTNLENQAYLMLDEIVVSKSSQNQGIGSQIMDFIESQAVNQGVEVIFLATGVRNNQAQKFYLNKGFAIGSLFMYKKISHN